MLFAPPADAVRGPDQITYSMAASWSQRTVTLSGTETIRFRNNGTVPLSRIWLRHWPNGWRAVGSGGAAAGCAAPIASLRVTGGGRLGARTVGCTAYRIDLAGAVPPGAGGSVRVAFRVRVPRADDRFGRAGRYANLGNAVPVLAVHDAAGWHLDRYSSTGESFYSLAADWNVTLKMPKGIRAATTGQVLRTSHGALVIEARSVRDFALATGPFRVVTATAGTTRIRLSAPKDMRTGLVAGAMRLSRTAVVAYERRYGPYGAPELDVVLGTFSAFGGMEYPQLVLTAPEFRPVRHEIAHQWFYGAVGNDQRQAPWLDESFASWLEQDLSGFPRCSSPPVRVVPGVFLDSGMDVFDRRPDVYGRIVYTGGACALEEIADGIGHGAFRALLRSYVAAHRDGVATKADFIAALRAAAPPSFDVDAWAARARLRLG
ncbi:MAG: hypothetical protein QOE98_1906 [Gaiellaceae bacterium]|nr:hypothetical protein [Gaiellaceae bacterium]